MLETPAPPTVPTRAAEDTVPTDPHLHIGQQPSDPGADTKRLLTWAQDLRAEQHRVLGFPGALDFDFSELGPMLSVFANNVGDAGSLDASAVHAKAFEQAVIGFFAETAGAAPEDVYGYLTTGGSEGILYGLATARRHLPHARVYASDQAHYSVHKAAQLLGLEVTTVASREDGTMDPAALRMHTFVHRRIRPRLGRGPGAIVLATIGTTMRGAYDDVTALRRVASTAGAVYVHADAALGGLVAAHAPSRPAWSFEHGADSVSMSGHKIIGSPVPCGVVLVRRELVTEAAGAEYVKATDHTLGCSRSGLAAMLMWSALRRLGHDGMRQRIRAGLEMADYATRRLASVGADPSRPTDSLVVCFDRPDPWIVDRWHLACEGDTAHIVTVAHVGRQQIDDLCADLASGRRP
ncbi:histidine decarboxylase (plasmid) [Streptomyces sp. NBC_01544]|uniref:histidine decarboxylase n=1 Tax=Streptomyces sp. NBC_01544 TaxID=2975871 RepID=UPI0038692C1B